MKRRKAKAEQANSSANRSHPGGARLRLAKREFAVAQLVAQGLCDKEIATALAIRESTVGWYLSRIYARAAIHSRSALTALLLKGGFAVRD